MEIHDEVVKVLTEANLMVIINNHVRKLKVRTFGLLSGARKAELYFDWLSFAYLTSHNTGKSKDFLIEGVFFFGLLCWF